MNPIESQPPKRYNAEFDRLLQAAERLGREWLALTMETILAAGLRVSEVQYITVEALREEKAEIRLKGKIRTILLSAKLCRKLRKYAKQQKIASDPVFRAESGAPLSRFQIWREMKSVCRTAPGMKSQGRESPFLRP